MGLSGISIFALLVFSLVVILLFGPKRLGGVGADLGAAIRNFQRALADVTDASASTRAKSPPDVETRPKI